MVTKQKVIGLDNGIKVTLTVVDDGTNTSVTTFVENMIIVSGTSLSHVGGRSDDR